MFHLESGVCSTLRGPRSARAWLCVVGLLAGIAIAMVPTVHAQTLGGQPREQVEEVAPELFYLQDEAGQLVPVPGFRYRDFVDLLRLKEGLPGLPETPSAVVENVTVKGVMPAAENVRPSALLPQSKPAIGQPDVPLNQSRICTVTVEVTVRQVRAGWVSVPLEMDGLVLTDLPRYEGPGQSMIDTVLVDAVPRMPIDAGGKGIGLGTSTVAGGVGGTQRPPRGYRAWFKSAEDTKHTLTLQGNVAVDSSGAAEAMTLQIPTATATLVEISTWRVDPEVVVQPAPIAPQIQQELDGAGSTITCVGLSGSTHIRIGSRSVGNAIGRAVPQALVESLVRIDGRTAVIEAVLTFENLPVDTATLRIQLPPGQPAEDASAAQASPVVVQIDRGQDGRAVVEMACKRTIDSSGKMPFDPLGFAVEGIPSWRQRGRASFVVDGEWQLDWDDPGSNRRIDPPQSARLPGFVAAFAYDAQPATLPTRVRPRSSRVVIEPEYRYEIGATRISMDAKLRVSVRGAAVSKIVVGLDGWSIDEVGPASFVDTAAVSGDAGRLVIPFSQPLSGDAIVDIRCGRSIDRSAERIDCKIPVPQADLVGPALVVIMSESNIEILPDSDAIRGLVRQVTPTLPSGDRGKVALAYRLDGTDGLFVAARRFVPRRVESSVTAKATIDESQTEVEETIRFEVAYRPLEYIDLLVPESVAQSGTLEVRQGGQLLEPLDLPRQSATDPMPDVPGDDAVLPDGSDPADGGDPAALPPAPARLRAMLLVPLLGSGELVVRYILPTATVPPETTIATDLPLVLPLDVRVGRQFFSVVSPELLAIDVRGDVWKQDAGTQSPLRVWTAAKPQEFVPLALAVRQRLLAGETVVEAAWLETRLTRDRREDVYTYAIASSADRIRLSLPAGFIPLRESKPDPSAVEVRLDGRLLSGAVRSDGRVVAELPLAAAGRGAWLLQVEASRQRSGWLAGPAGTGVAGSSLAVAGVVPPILLESPLFPDGTLLRRFYWELRLESDEHVVVSPSRWTSQQRWTWGTFGLERTPIVSRDVLAAWVQANTSMATDTPAVARPITDKPLGMPVDVPLAERRAVYSGVGPPGSASVRVLPTWLLVLVVSGPVLGLGLAMVYRPGMRSTPVVLGIASTVALAAAMAPDLSPLMAQAAIPGALLSLVAGALRGIVDVPTLSGRVKQPAVVITSKSSTHMVPAPSVLIRPSAMRLQESVTAARRSNS